MAHYWDTFLVILRTPFLHTDLLWGIVPLYFGWLLNELTSSKASFRTALQTGRRRNGSFNMRTSVQ